jgi:ankyrin repeat protein
VIYHAGPVALHTFSTMGGTPLHWACAAASSETLSDAPEEDEARILQRRQDVIQALLELGADINAFRPPPALAIPPPLFLLVASTDDRLSHFFLSQHPKRNLQPSLDFVLTPVNATPVHMAADLNLVKSLQWLICYYQELEARDRATEEDTTASSSVSVFERLDFEGYTPLDMAAKEKHVECVRLLLQATQGNASVAEAQDFIDNWKPRAPPTPSETPTSSPLSRDSNDTVEGDAVEHKAKQDASQILLQRASISPENADADEPKQAAPLLHNPEAISISRNRIGSAPSTNTREPLHCSRTKRRCTPIDRLPTWHGPDMTKTPCTTRSWPKRCSPRGPNVAAHVAQGVLPGGHRATGATAL